MNDFLFAKRKWWARKEQKKVRRVLMFVSRQKIIGNTIKDMKAQDETSEKNVQSSRLNGAENGFGIFRCRSKAQSFSFGFYSFELLWLCFLLFFLLALSVENSWLFFVGFSCSSFTILKVKFFNSLNRKKEKKEDWRKEKTRRILFLQELFLVGPRRFIFLFLCSCAYLISVHLEWIYSC